MPKRTVRIDCTVELDDDFPIEAIELMVRQDPEKFKPRWAQALMFVFGRGVKIRQGLHLELDNFACKIIDGGRDDPEPPCPKCGHDEYAETTIGSDTHRRIKCVGCGHTAYAYEWREGASDEK